MLLNSAVNKIVIQKWDNFALVFNLKNEFIHNASKSNCSYRTNVKQTKNNSTVEWRFEEKCGEVEEME